MKDPMLSYESQYSGVIIGIDEAGRGPLFGPVVSSAVILNTEIDWTGLNDSKKLSQKKRENFYDLITSNCVYGIGISTSEEIDRLNILEATKLAMCRAIENIELFSQYKALFVDQSVQKVLLVDAVKLAYKGFTIVPIIKGDAKSYSIAAASVVAKVTRDRMMEEYQRMYPEYSFLKHKGYPTKKHYEEIKNFGITKDHRKTFLKRL